MGRMLPRPPTAPSLGLHPGLSTVAKGWEWLSEEGLEMLAFAKAHVTP